MTQRLGHLVEELLFSSNQMTGEVRVSPVHEEHMVIQVSDTGSGIPEQDLDRIFNAIDLYPLYRL